MPQRIDPTEPSRRYSQKELAGLWRVHRVTVRKWIQQLRRQGRGPTTMQAKVKLINGAHRDLMIRADYALLIEAVFIEGQK
jgi:transposase-like protein